MNGRSFWLFENGGSTRSKNGELIKVPKPPHNQQQPANLTLIYKEATRITAQAYFLSQKSFHSLT